MSATRVIVKPMHKCPSHPDVGKNDFGGTFVLCVLCSRRLDREPTK